MAASDEESSLLLTRGLTRDEKATIADRRRVWEVRKYCQAKPSIVQYRRHETGVGRQSVGTKSLHDEEAGADPALTALLRGVLNQLDADIAMISLLDDHTQFFLSGATSDNSSDAQPGLSSAQWYGCDDVTHHGGLCERTITLKNNSDAPAFYEVPDMAESPLTQCLPFVDGSIAKFRHYLGTPITTAEGINIGTVFIMSNDPAGTATSQFQRNYLFQTAKHVMGQLVQATEALEGRRAERFNEGLFALLNGHPHPNTQNPKGAQSAAEDLEKVEGVYETAARLAREFFDLEGCIFQEVPLARSSARSTNLEEKRLLASELQPGMEAVYPLEVLAVQKLLEAFPQGGILHVDDTGDERRFAGAAYTAGKVMDSQTNASLNKSFPGAWQVIFSPLWDATHSRTVAVCVGWVSNDSRVYRPETDSPAMSAFCMATVSHIQRLESQMLNQVKSDFLGSISHETRSPLHNVLGNLELLLDTNLDADQKEMLVNAQFGATQLLETIDKILMYSRVQPQRGSMSLAVASKLKEDHLVPTPEQGGWKCRSGSSRSSVSRDTSIVELSTLCEEVVEEVAKRLRLSDIVMSPIARRRESEMETDSSVEDGTHILDSAVSVRTSNISLDTQNATGCLVRRDSGFRLIFENILSNAVKFSRPGCSVRVRLAINGEECHLEVTDCGRGFSRDFIRHSLYIPFSQQDPIDNGVGLGLSLIKQHVDTLGGTIRIDTEEALGSIVRVSIPIANLIDKSGSKVEHDVGVADEPVSTSDASDRPVEDLPPLRVFFYHCLEETGRFDDRNKRSVKLLCDSIQDTLGNWFRPTAMPQDNSDDENPSGVAFVAAWDLEEFQRTPMGRSTDVKTIVLCPGISKCSEMDERTVTPALVKASAIIMGPVTPSKMAHAMAIAFPHVVSKSTTCRAGSVVAGAVFQASKANQRRKSSPSDQAELNGAASSNGAVTRDAEDRNTTNLTLPERIGRPQTAERHDSKQNVIPQGSESTSSAPSSLPNAVDPSRDVGTDHNGDLPPEAQGQAAVADATTEQNRSESVPQESESIDPLVHGTGSRHPSGDANSELAEDASPKPVKQQLTKPLARLLPKSSSSSRRTSNTSAISDVVEQPRLLLVDDSKLQTEHEASIHSANIDLDNINLSVLKMFVKKSGITISDVTTAGGGQEAIDKYTKAASAANGDDASGFDIIFMDLVSQCSIS